MSECSTEEWANQVQNRLRCLTRGQAIGSAFRVETGFVSLVAVISVFILIIRNIHRHRARAPAGSWSLVERPADIYLLGLFTFDFLQALGRCMDTKWVREGKVYVGGYCNASGSISQIGEAGSAQITLAISIHTFIAVWFRRGARARLVAAFVVVLFALYTSLLVGISLARHPMNSIHPYIAPSKLWCWVDPEDNVFLAQQLAGEYIWIWSALVMSCLTYIPLHFMARGNITVDTVRPWKFRIHKRNPLGRKTALPLGLIVYPASYAICVLPISIVRWYGFFYSVNTTITFTCSTMFGLIGLFNSILLFTRPNALLFGSPESRALAHDNPSSSTSTNMRTRSSSQHTIGANRMSMMKRSTLLPEDVDDDHLEGAALRAHPRAHLRDPWTGAGEFGHELGAVNTRGSDWTGSPGTKSEAHYAFRSFT